MQLAAAIMHLHAGQRHEVMNVNDGIHGGGNRRDPSEAESPSGGRTGARRPIRPGTQDPLPPVRRWAPLQPHQRQPRRTAGLLPTEAPCRPTGRCATHAAAIPAQREPTRPMGHRATQVLPADASPPATRPRPRQQTTQVPPTNTSPPAIRPPPPPRPADHPGPASQRTHQLPRHPAPRGPSDARSDPTIRTHRWLNPAYRKRSLLRPMTRTSYRDRSRDRSRATRSGRGRVPAS